MVTMVTSATKHLEHKTFSWDSISCDVDRAEQEKKGNKSEITNTPTGENNYQSTMATR